jgi:hypothetical protein
MSAIVKQAQLTERPPWADIVEKLEAPQNIEIIINNGMTFTQAYCVFARRPAMLFQYFQVG